MTVGCQLIKAEGMTELNNCHLHSNNTGKKHRQTIKRVGESWENNGTFHLKLSPRKCLLSQRGRRNFEMKMLGGHHLGPVVLVAPPGRGHVELLLWQIGVTEHTASLCDSP